MRPIPVPPPVMTATRPSTPNKEAASREDILEEGPRIATDVLDGTRGGVRDLYTS